MEDDDLEFSNRKILHIPIGQVVPGMTTARDIYSQNDQLILSKNNILHPNIIAKLMFYAVSNLYVYEPEEKDSIGDSYYDKIKKSTEFQTFHIVYREVLDELKECLNQVLQFNQPVSETQLIHRIKKIIQKGKGKYHLFELLYSVHEHDEMTLAHSINVALICNLFGQWLHMGEDEIDCLTLCGLMHDVGKIAVPQEILSKPERLTHEEFEIVKDHPEQGYLMLLTQDIDPRIRLSALMHHERYDGTGYPFGKMGDEIHPFAMITAIADVFDAMTSNRVYRGAICPFSVLEMFEQEGKLKYDLNVSMPLMERVAEIYINHTVRLSNQSQGEVIMLNRHALSRPVVKVGNEFIDLSKQKNLKIESVV